MNQKLEDIAEKYKVPITEVAIQYAKNLSKIMDQYPTMTPDWYLYEANRRTKQYFKEQNGGGSQWKKQDGK